MFRFRVKFRFWLWFWLIVAFDHLKLLTTIPNTMYIGSRHRYYWYVHVTYSHTYCKYRTTTHHFTQVLVRHSWGWHRTELLMTLSWPLPSQGSQYIPTMYLLVQLPNVYVAGSWFPSPSIKISTTTPSMDLYLIPTRIQCYYSIPQLQSTTATTTLKGGKIKIKWLKWLAPLPIAL